MLKIARMPYREPGMGGSKNGTSSKRTVMLGANGFSFHGWQT